MNKSIEQMQQNLNLYYKNDLEKYNRELNDIKNIGFRIFRNQNGDHKIQKNENYIYEVFGGVFGKIFKGEN